MGDLEVLYGPPEAEEDQDPLWRAWMEAAVRSGVQTVLERYSNGAQAAAVPAWLQGACRLLRGPGLLQISLSLAGEKEMQALNRAYRGVDAPTDVLSFPMFSRAELESWAAASAQPEDYGAEAVPISLGDVVVCQPVAVRQAESYGHSLPREVGFLTVHGLLHLLGFDHEDPGGENEMFSLQEAALARLGLGR